VLVFLQNFLRRYYLLAAVSASLGVLALSSIPSPPQPDWSFPFLDKIAHTIIYSLLGLSYLCSFTKGFLFHSTKIIIAAFLAACLFGIFDEFFQSFIPGRFSELGDWIADIIGVSLGFCLYFFIKKKFSS
jgi:VanZ family protein